MSGVNKVLILGNVGKDPEIRYLPSGGAVANLSIATSEKWKDKQTGQQQEKTEWHRCSAFGKLAEIIGEYVKKGSKIYVEGSIHTRKWQAQDGTDRYSTEIKVRSMQMLDSRGETDSTAPQAQSNHSAQPAQQPVAAQQSGGYDSFDDDIPF